jgi:predicted Ser/Thr protein kinase
MRGGVRCVTLDEVGNAKDDHADRSASLTIPGRPEALREESSGKDRAQGSGRTSPSAHDHDDAGGHLPSGATLGRYVVTGCVGAGGMGVVYSARDPDLDRRVALKVLRPELSVETNSRARLLREARAMAQLSHPNVVPIYDVGVLGDQVFIAMELVEGVTLRNKLDRTTPWRTVVSCYLQAARGLAAAHAAGLVHRDFKPDNVLFGNDGRIRVVDFGLVSLEPVAPTQRTSFDALRSGLGPMVHTTVGVVLGTPAFMAPEAIRGEPTDARADLFSFCVALFHGLYGVYPHGGATLAERAELIEQGKIARPASSAVPQRVYRALVRGLSAQPDHRYRSMEALAHALEHAVAPRRRARMIALGVAGAAVLGGIVTFVALRGSSGRTSPLQLGPPETIARTDDKQLAVTMLHDGRYLRIEHGGITVVSADGSQSHALTVAPGRTPSRARATGTNGWAEVYVEGTPCSWWLAPIDGGAWRLLLDDPSCTSEVDLSPDGKQLAIARGAALVVRDLTTGVERTLLSQAYGVASDKARMPTWSPDGKRIVLDGEIAVVDLVSGKDVHYGRIGAAASWLDADRLVYVIRTWISSEIRLLDLRTGADQLVIEEEGAVRDLATWRGGILVRRDELHSRAYLAAMSGANPTSVEELTQLDTGAAIDFLPTTWTQDGALITLAMVAGQRGLVRTIPGQRGAPLVLHRAHNILHRGSTQGQIVYSLNDTDECEIRVFDLATGKDRFWRKARCAQQPYITCARLQSRCLVVDEQGSRWFDLATMQFDGGAPHIELGENLSPDATASVRVRGGAVVLRDLASGVETPIEAPKVEGSLDVTWGGDSSTLLAVATSPGHQRLMVKTRDAGWRIVIDEPHRLINGYTASADGSRVALVALLPASTWSYLPFATPLER